MNMPAFATGWLGQRLGWWGTLAIAVLVCAAPLLLYYNLLVYYRLHSDDFAYLAASRTLGRALDHFYTPHNTHIVPAWRILTWSLSAIAGRLANLQAVLAVAAYSALVLVMLALGAFVARETQSAAIGLVAMAGLGTSSLLATPATWYSAGQTLWAGLGILGTLLFLQGFKRNGGVWRLALAALMAWLAGGLWTIGHAAGPVGAVYLWTDARPRSRRAAWVPLAATVIAIAIAMTLGGRRINATISFGGRTTMKASDPAQGVLHTLQSIPENLVLGNLGLVAETTLEQGAVLTLTLALAWYFSRRGRGPMTPLECAGVSLVLLSYLVEWTVRGYLPYSSLRAIVPWYDTIPDIGFVLFLAGWWAAVARPGPPSAFLPLTLGQAAGIVLFQVALVFLHQPRVEALLQQKVPEMTAEERKLLPVPSLQHWRAVYLAERRWDWQHRAFARLDRAEEIARRLGIGRKAIREVFGRVEVPGIPFVYDAADMLDLPWEGTAQVDPARVREALEPWVALEPDPSPPGSLIKDLGQAGMLRTGPSGPK